MRLLDVMTADPVVASPSDPVGTARRLMAEHSIRHLPLVEDGRLVGIVSDRDLRAFSPPVTAGLDQLEGLLDLLDTPLRGVGRSDVVAFGPDGQVGDAIDAMVDARLGAVCVVDDEDKLLGIVSYVDVLRAVKAIVPRGLLRRATGELGMVHGSRETAPGR